MEILAEILLECLTELVVEGGSGAAANPRLPKWLRVLVLGGMALLFAAVFAAILIVGIMALPESPLAGVLMFALDAGLIVMSVYKLRKILRSLQKA